MAQRKRLVVCLDGTWNTRDDSTNVFHHFAMVAEGDVPHADGGVITQRKEYIQGVGTGPLDSLTGGGFGIGLEENVRKAYNWLVQNYSGGDGNGTPGDEIYIFGFSRGAYTARSLVGFIASCGLLKRGAPLTVNQLWQNHCILGRQREERQSFWELLCPGEVPASRRITELAADAWSKRVVNTKAQSDTERLLVGWSRRAKITYLGLYDTVGAMGIDALAIPGITSKLAMHHNLRPTTLIQRCRHALAMDEHRVSFKHSPFVRYVGHKSELSEVESGAGHAHDDTSHSGRNLAMWNRKIEQRWFVGAHSNIGGGYPDNELAQIPFRWLFEGAQEAETGRVNGRYRKEGLKCESVLPSSGGCAAPIRDSYAEFAKPFWTMVIRGKRFYRQIAPGPEYKACRRPRLGATSKESGFSLQSINERIDPSVYTYWSQTSAELPPNLVEFARRELAENPAHEDRHKLKRLADSNPKHAWMKNSGAAYAFLVVWTSFIAVGIEAMNRLFRGEYEYQGVPPWVLFLSAFVFSIVDWAESRVNFILALKPSTPSGRAFLDSIYWLRSFGFIAFVTGAAAGLTVLWVNGWKTAGESETWDALLRNGSRMLQSWWPIPACAGLGMFVASLFEDQSFARVKFAARALAVGVVASLAIAVAALFCGWLFGRIFAPVFGLPEDPERLVAFNAKFAGMLLFMEIALLYVARGFTWANEPTGKANLPSIVVLQFSATPRKVMQTLEKWRAALASSWDPRDQDQFRGPAAFALRDLIRHELWRDVIGFIPTYIFVMSCGLWFASKYLGEAWLTKTVLNVPLYALIPAITAFADYVEDALHLHFLDRHAEGKAPALGLTLLGTTMAVIKFAAFSVGAYAVCGAVAQGIFRLAIDNADTGWRGTLALLLPSAGAGLFVILAVGIAALRLQEAPVTRVEEKKL